MLLAEKNQKYPVSVVSGAANPTPLVPCAGTRHETSTLNRLPLRHSAVALGEQAASTEDTATLDFGPWTLDSVTLDLRPWTLDSASTEATPPSKAAVSAMLASVPEGLKYVCTAWV